MVLQYRQVGPWRDYQFGEKAHIVLSLTAKSALAWQVFAGTLAGWARSQPTPRRSRAYTFRL